MTQLTFLYTQNELQATASRIINRALNLGASAAQVELSECISTDVEVLNQQIENFETSHENQLLLTVYIGHQKGNVGISSINQPNLDELIQQALDIAKYTEVDPANGLLEPQYQLRQMPAELYLFHECNLDNQTLISSTKELEQLALDQDKRISASDGASISLTKYNFVLANSNGFNFGYKTSRYAKFVSLITETETGMQTDYWYSSSRDYLDLEPNLHIAQMAAARVLRRINKAQIQSAKPTLIFASSIAKSIIGNLISALSGNNLYRRLSFLNDSLGTTILPTWVNISEDPFIAKGLASCYYDNEGCMVSHRKIIADGMVNGYFLSSYSARKMEMLPTGSAGGSHNIQVSTNFSGDMYDLARQINSGIIIIETTGQGLNMVTGDYSVGASGLSIENGIVAGFVDNLTIAGNLREIFNNLSLIANDSEPGSIQCGSMLINSGVIQVTSK